MNASDTTRFGTYHAINMREADGVLEMRIHRDGKAAKWDFSETGIHGELGAAFGAIARAADLRAVILTGSGDTFLTELDASGSSDLIDAQFWHRIYREGVALLENLMAIPVPMIAAVNGNAFLHAELPVLCDIVLAAQGAKFADKAHFIAGVVPGDGVHVVWPMLLGPNLGRYFLLTGAEIDAQEGQRIGFVAEVLPPSELLPRAWTLARQITSRPPQVGRYTRKLLIKEIRERLAAELSEGLMLEGMALLSG